MAQGITLPSTKDRTILFEALIPQVEALLDGETDLIAAMANVAAAIHGTFGWHWVGFYRVVGQELVLGPFQGPVACARIPYGKGVCGTAWKEDRTLVVPDVDLFPGHIACSALSRSEVVVPIHDRTGTVVAVLDIDSSLPDDLSPADAAFLERICRSLAPIT
jgi:L-methionine (R)-S-oxide reductase